MHGKPAPYNAGCLDAVYGMARKHIASAKVGRVIVLGVRLPETEEDDPRLDGISDEIRSAGCTSVYVSPDEHECERAERLGFSPIQLGFDAALAAGHL